MLLPVTSKKLSACFCLLIISASAALAQKVIKVDTSHIKTLRIDPSNAMGGNVSDFFSEVNYIPLETTKESLFGSISSLTVTDDHFIIFDQNTQAILIFDKNGKFHAKIKGSQTYPICDYWVNKFTKQIVYSKDMYETYTFCDFNGKPLKTLKTANDFAKDEIGNDMRKYYFSQNKAISYSYPNNLDSTSKYYKTYSKSLIIYADDKNKVYAQGLSFDAREAEGTFLDGGLGPVTNSDIDTVFFYSKPYTYHIYSITPGTIQYTYKFIFPLQMALPDDFLHNPIYKRKEIVYIAKHPNAIYGITNFFRINNNLVFKTAIDGDSKEDHLIYNLKSGSLIGYKHIQQDERSHFIPIYDPTGNTFNSRGILAGKDGSIYTSISALGMYKAYNDNADKNVKYTPALAEYFKKGSIKDNPSILQLKLKNDL